MAFNPKNHTDKLLFTPLGGSSEIGMNVNLYQYKGKWIMMDLGAGFADDYAPGIDMLVADISFITKYKKDLLGLFLTHAHEDHLGAVVYLWQELKCPIYTTKFTKNFLLAKLKEYDFADQVKIIEVNSGDRIELGPFEIEMFPLTHSAPEMHGMFIRTEKGNILHTGDWKFDDDPLIGDVNDEKLLENYGKEGVLALVCDSTNVFNNKMSGSEGKLRESLIDIIAGCKKMVVVTTFASNLARIDTIIHAAEAAGRRVVISGRSLWRIIGAAKDSGYLQDISGFVDERDIGKYDRDKILVIATGCQGEPLAATNKLASRSHPNIKLAQGDTVIFSSKIIPGNEKSIFRLFNIFVKEGVEVITEKDHFVHVSGHPSSIELEKMHKLVKPAIAIPVHGEAVHIHEHAKLAREWGAKHAIEVENGSIVDLDYHNPKIIDKAETGYLCVDGNYLLPIDSPVIRMRRRMRESGIIILNLVINKRLQLAAPVNINSPGCLDPIEDAEFLNFMKAEIFDELSNLAKSKNKCSQDTLEQKARSVIRRCLKHEIGKSPIIQVSFTKIEK